MKMDNKAEKQVKRDAVNTDGSGNVGRTIDASAEPLETHRLTAEEIEELKEGAAKAKEHWDQLLRTAADFENFKKRAARERQELSKYANESLLQKLIPILDNLEMALTAAHTQPATLESLQTGITMIHQQLKAALAEAGLEEIDAANKAFDPNWHEALSQQETGDVAEGQVVQQLRKGYRLRDRLLRPAGVVVAKKPAGM
jgi:molecular chaperone GrpE